MIVNPKLGSVWELGSFRILVESRGAGGDVGGDFFAFLLRGPNRLAVVIGDVCGRGAEGARLLPQVLAPLDELSQRVERPSELLAGLNQQLTGRMASDRFVTGAVLELDATAGTLVVANAAHVPAMLRSAGGEVTVVGRASGPPLGILASCEYQDESHPLHSGDVLVFMTDGVLEAVETDLDAMSRLAAVVGQQPGGSRDVHRRLLATLPTYPPARRADDMTLVSLELLATELPVPSNLQPVT
jgi:sigma-B regulation protein RsbU (phosphoserine phosphatase)